MSLLDQYTPVLRYFSPAKRALVTLTKEGATLIRRLEDDDWKIAARKKQALSYDEWIAIKRNNIAQLPAWALDVQDLPSLEDIETWVADGLCQTPTGHDVEPDGHGPDGVPSWLLLLGMI
ncbi:MAG TPA: hypothetical protein VMU78_09935 [Methylocella sp.]|nr:hypothetical protein [Methylocella sp.]